MLIWSLVLSLATLQVAQAAPKPGRPQYSSLGKHGGVATEVRTYDPRGFSLDEMAFSHCRDTYRVDRLRNAQKSESICSRKVEARLTL